MIPLNDQDVEALLKMSDKELVKLAVAPTAAIRLRRDAAHVQHLPDVEVERKQVRRAPDFPLKPSPISAIEVTDQTGTSSPREGQGCGGLRSRLPWQGWTRRPRTGRL